VRLTEYIENDDIVTGLKLIEKNCKPFLKEWLTSQNKNDIRYLFSGRDSHIDFEKKSVRVNRTPLSTNISIHKSFDNAFKKEFGWNARSNSIFCTGREDVAASYGDNLYVIFPIGKYKYLWSSRVGDLFMYISKSDIAKNTSIDQRGENPVIRSITKDNCSDDSILKSFKDEWEDIYGDITLIRGYWDAKIEDGTHVQVPRKHNQHPDEWLSDNHYVVLKWFDMVWTPDVTYDDYYKKQFKQFKDVMVSSCRDNAVEKWESFVDDALSTYHNDNLIKGIKSGHEIMIGCKSYYMLNYYENGDIIDEWARSYKG